MNTAKTVIPHLCEHFNTSIEEALQDYPAGSVEERWNHIRNAIYNSALTAFGKKEKQTPDWFQHNMAKLEPLIEAKRIALTLYKNMPSRHNLCQLRKARKDTQQAARRCANNYWKNLCQNIQLSADHGDTRGMYDGMKKAFGPTIRKVALLKSAEGETITDRSKQMSRWAEHYQDLYSKREHCVN